MVFAYFYKLSSYRFENYDGKSKEVVKMSRLEIFTPDRATLVIEDLYRTLDKRIEASPPGLCPVDITRAFQ